MVSARLLTAPCSFKYLRHHKQGLGRGPCLWWQHTSIPGARRVKRAILADLLTACRDKKPAALVTVLASGQQTVVYPHTDPASTALAATTAHAAQEALRKDRSGIGETVDGTLFIQVLTPPPRMLIVGAVHIAQALAPMANLAGYEVTVIDPRRAFATAERFPSCDLVTEWPERALPRLAPDRKRGNANACRRWCCCAIYPGL